MKINEELNKHLSEAQQLQRCMAILNTCKVNAWRNNTGMTKYESNRGPRVVRYGHKGYLQSSGRSSADITRDGRFFGFEVKKHAKKPTQLQKNFIENAQDYGCVIGYGTANDLVDLLTNYNLL